MLSLSARAVVTTSVLLGFALPGPAQPQFVMSPVVSPPLQFAYLVDDLSLADIDGDHDIDIVTVSTDVTSLLPLVLVNDGHGNFSVASGRIPLTRARCSTMGDIDGDGDVDLIALRYQPTGPDHLVSLLNDGRGVFTTVSDVAITQLGPSLMSLFDADGDGDLDLLLSGGITNGLFINAGAGVFRDETASRLPFGTVWCRTADIDGDGAVDILNARTGVLEVWRNDRSGRFALWQAVAVPWFGNIWTLPVPGDVDGDGDQDVLVVTWGQDSLLLNDGRGQLAYDPSRLPARMSLSHRAAFGDIDEDGDLDLVIANGLNDVPGYVPWVYVNDGHGRFSDATGTRLGTSPTGCLQVALADLDGDRDLDIAFGRENASGFRPMLFFTNRLRHAEGPGAARIGTAWPVQLWGRAGFSTAPQVGFPFATTQLALPPIHLPWGTIFLGAGVISLPGVVLPPPSGTAIAPVPVPNLGSLVGQTGYMQAVILHDVGAFGVTSLARVQIIP